MDNKVRVLDMTSSGSDNDYDIKCISAFRGTNQLAADKSTIEDVQIMGKFALALNSQGIISMFGI